MNTVSPVWDNDEADNLEDVVRFELACLWDDLDKARRAALRGAWSIGCETATGRIVMLSRFVGACPWVHVQVDLLLDGTYQKVYDGAGMAYEPIDWELVREVDTRNRAGTRP